MKKGQTNSGSFKKGHHSATEFKKGLIPHNKGKKRPEEWSKKQSVTMKKRYADGLVAHNKGKKASEKTKRKQSESAKKLYASGYVHPQKGKHPKPESIKKGKKTMAKRFENGYEVWNKGKTGIFTEEALEKISLAGKGRTPPNKGKKASEKTKQRQSISRKKLIADGYVHPMKGKKQDPEWTAKSKKTMAKRFENGYEVWNKDKTGVMPPPWNKDKTGVYSEETLELIREARLHQVFPAKDAKTTEIPLQKLLKENNIKFEKHKPILGQPDIFIEPNICIFADGDYWHANPKFHKHDSQILSHRGLKPAYKIWEKDERINQKLIQKGHNVLRLWEDEIKRNPEKCLQKIIKAIKESKSKT